MTTLSSLVYTDVQLANVTNLQVTTAASFGQANLAFSQANAAFLAANNAVTDFSPAFIQANTARDHANAAFFKANTAVTDFSPAFNQANAAYAQANLALPASGGTISGNLVVDGSLTVSGNVSFVDTETLKISDPLIYLAGNNYTSDTVDIGFIGNYVNATGSNVHTGIFRDATTKEYYVFEGYDAEPTNNHINPQGNNFTISVLNTTLKTSNLILGGANAISTIGAAFNKANAALPNTSGAAFAGNLNLPTGNLAVGIASANAGAKLQVYNTSGNSELWITADNGYDPTLRLTGEAGEIGNEGFSIRYDNSVGDTYFENRFGAVTSYHFLTSVVEALTIHTDGKVGVGETNPQHILDVKGTANVSSSLLVNDMNVKPTIQAAFLKANNALANTAGISTAGGLIVPGVLTSNIGGGGLALRAGGTANHVYIEYYPRSATAGRGVYMGFGSAGSNTFTLMNETTTGSLEFGTAGAVDMTIDSAGEVGIGRTDPGYKLDVVGVANASNVLVNQNMALTTQNYNSYAPTLTGTGASGTWSINVTGSAGSATTATNTTQVGGISSDRVMMKRRSRINTSDGTSLNSSITAPEMGFTYGGSGEPAGPYIAFGGLSGNIDYSCQLVGEYNNSGNNFKIRTRNDDSATWNAWRTILTDGNYNSYSPTLTGGGASGTWGISITGSADSATTATNLSGGSVSTTGITIPSTGTERTVKWNFTGRDVYIFGRDSDDVVGLYDTVGGLRWTSSATNVFYAPTMSTGGFTSTGRIYSNEWVQFDNYTGIYSPNNNAHFYPNNGTYGSWYCRGTRNSWAGIEFYDSSTTLMMNTDNYGFHYNGVGWRMYVTGGSLYVPGDITAYWSDRRLKENLKPIGSEASDILSKLTAYRFNWNDKVENFNIDVEPGKEEIGLIAQEVQAVLPDAVTINKAGSKIDEKGNTVESDYLTIKWNKITPLLVQALNDTTKKLDDTTRELNELKQLLKDRGIL